MYVSIVNKPEYTNHYTNADRQASPPSWSKFNKIMDTNPHFTLILSCVSLLRMPLAIFVSFTFLNRKGPIIIIYNCLSFDYLRFMQYLACMWKFCFYGDFHEIWYGDLSLNSKSGHSGYSYLHNKHIPTRT